MYWSLKKIKPHFTPKKILILLSLFVSLGLISCVENSDKIVAESSEVAYFEIDQIIETDFDFNTSNLKEKVVVLEGLIEDINYLNNRFTIILKGKQLDGRSVICDMQSNQEAKLKSLNVGETIKIKGILKGSLKDIILLNCIIPQPKTNE